MTAGDSYDRAYEADRSLFGNAPEATLVRFADLLPAAGPVLDVGCGQGRNAFHLARRGHTVHALDPSVVAVTTVARQAVAEGLPVVAIHGELLSFIPPVDDYAGIMIFGLVPILSRLDVGRLAAFVHHRTSPGGLVWLTAFTVDDPGYTVHVRDWETVGRHSFRSPDGGLRTYLEGGEILDLVAGFEVLHHHEGPGPEHRHGDSAPERHAIAEVVARRA